jgi:exosome complex component CSL4
MMADDDADDGFVVPGDRLGASADFDAGPGAYARDAHVVASRLGVRTELPSARPGGRPLLSVAPPGGGAAAAEPAVGSVVTARVTRIQQLVAACEIVVLDGATLPAPASAVIRRENVRDGEIDKIAMGDCFRPGDLVRAEVVSLGDARAYYLSTAAPPFGVVHALSDAGAVLVAVAHDTMEDPVTGKRERRKVARLEGDAAAA